MLEVNGGHHDFGQPKYYGKRTYILCNVHVDDIHITNLPYNYHKYVVL